jgi:uncharacterized repeat protein (TIGR01451 family)
MVYIKMPKKTVFYLFVMVFFILIQFSIFQFSFAANNTIDTTKDIDTGISGTGDGDTLFLEPGIYNKSGKDFNININSNIVIQGNDSADNVTIDARGLFGTFCIGDNVNVTFINSTFTRLNSNINNGSVIYNTFANSNITFVNCKFINNTCMMYGGVIYNVGGKLSVINSCFDDNGNGSIGVAYGGSIYNTANNLYLCNCSFNNNFASSSSAFYNNGANAYVDKCTFTNNIAKSNGAICNLGSNLTVIDSFFSGSTAGAGGCIYNWGDDLTVLNSVFNNNYVRNGGGAIYNSALRLKVTNSIFTGNIADGYGGAISNSGDNATVVDCNFINNSGCGGGAIYNSGGSASAPSANFLVLNCIFEDNKATVYNGGAISNEYAYSTNFTVINSNFTNNHANFGGGAISNECPNDFSVDNSNFANNTANNYGGAIYNYKGANFNLTNSNFTNNSASDGGVIYNNISFNFNVYNSIFTKNSADNAGAIYNQDSNGYVIANSTFKNNSARYFAGGILNNGSMRVTGNIMKDNKAGELADVIYNLGNMGILNLTYIDNTTKDVVNNTDFILYATLFDDMANPITGGNISFYVNGVYKGTATPIEGKANITYSVDLPELNLSYSVNGTYNGHQGYSIIMNPGLIKLVECCAYLTVTKTVNATSVINGDFLTYIITIYNNGPTDAFNVSISEILDSKLVLLSNNSTQGTYNNTIWNIGTITKGSTLTLTLYLRTNGTGIISNNITVNVTGNIGDTFVTCENVTVNPNIKLTVTKIANKTNLTDRKSVV